MLDGTNARMTSIGYDIARRKGAQFELSATKLVASRFWFSFMFAGCIREWPQSDHASRELPTLQCANLPRYVML